MYVLYTDGRFEYVPEEQYSINPSAELILSNGSIMKYKNNKITNINYISASGYVCSIDIRLVIVGPCKLTFENTTQTLFQQDFTSGIQFYYCNIPVYKNYPDGMTFTYLIQYPDIHDEDIYNIVKELVYYSYLCITYI